MSTAETATHTLPHERPDWQPVPEVPPGWHHWKIRERVPPGWRKVVPVYRVPALVIHAS